MKENQTFISLCIEGLAYPGDIVRYIDLWKSDTFNSKDRTLFEFLGMSADEYDQYMDCPSKIYDIVWAYRIKRMHIL